MRGRKLWQFVRRVGRVGQMDFEVAVWQMMWLLVSPKRVYRSVYYHKQTKNQWARDDPAFLVILIAALSLAALAYSISFASSPLDSFKLILSFIFLDFLLPGLLISTLAWFAPPVHLPPLHFISHFLASLSLSFSLSVRWFSNKLLRVQAVHSVEQSVEWAYSFDIHCNSFIPVFVILYLLQFFFMPILLNANFSILSTILGNTMYFVALVYYTYITFLGYNGNHLSFPTLLSLLHPLTLGFPSSPPLLASHRGVPLPNPVLLCLLRGVPLHDQH